MQKTMRTAPSNFFTARRWIQGLLLLSLTGGTLLTIQQSIRNPVTQDGAETVQVKRQTLPIVVTANGSVEPERSINVSPKTSGLLKRLLVREGDQVKAGQIIAEMDDSNLRGQLAQMTGNLASASANLQKLRAGNRPEEIAEAQAKLDEANAVLKEAELTLEQDKALYADGALSRRDLAGSESRRATAKAQVAQAREGLTIQTTGPRIEDIQAAEAAEAAAQGAVDQIQSQLDDMVIRAPFSGTVVRKYADPGAFVAPTTAASAENSATSSSILALGTKNRIVANVPETSIGRLRVGQTALIQADAFPGRTFTGTVAEIAPQSTVQQNVTSFEVKVSLVDPEELLRSGMNVSVDFQVGKLEDAVMVPTVAIVRQENQTGVYIQSDDDQTEFQPIQTGLTMGNQTEAYSGLQGDERVLIGLPKSAKSFAFPPFDSRP
ncbi:MAG: efflux RND transporter periplasmic adaptor subunit [Pegethrix bostrychoides GSE-TBD4-15B]|jgi:HlyD family secretion protein|uniref:Efflux RND transporter periplasmic adaptor subunit n=1 Tax=Pegethrix bostrychoides GSE-TBD4-15B TaxID=2839662 RepID=A0A951P8T5_9CYAN|nr:efflux RND transporter periplasmic adaptor subunit [Pegethrix bostrychoides GSE-TBD4-15B]